MTRFPFYPLCIGLFALLSLFASNADQASIRELLVPTSLVLTATMVLLALAALAMRNLHRAALLVAAIVFCFMTFGYWVDVLWAIHPDPNKRVIYHRTILVVQALVLACIAYAAIRRVKDPNSLTPKLNRFALVLLACPVLLVIVRWTSASLRSKPAAISVGDKSLLIASLNPAAECPDIYFIILDAHGREDVLREQYHYDDSAFLQHLRGKGFYVADQSTSNYMWTELSIPSALNMRYMDDVAGNDAAKLRQAADMLRNNTLVAELQTRGYGTVAFESVEKWLSLDNSDIYYRISNQIGFTPLQQLILDTSALSQFGGESIKSRLIPDQYQLKREIMLYKFAKMPQVAAIPGPKFVFLHVMEPHTPFVFAADGSDPRERGYGSMFDGLNNEVTDQQYHEWYREQAIYTDNQTVQMIDKVLARSRKPPVIVLIGDHGPRSGIGPDPDASNLRECMSNLTAVYLPGKKSAGLYPQITPVNLFRVVLNDYFDARLPLLPDKSYYSYPTQFELRDVTAFVKTTEDLPEPSSPTR